MNSSKFKILNDSETDKVEKLLFCDLFNLFFKNDLEYGQFIAKNNVVNPRGLVPVKIKPGYHIDMQSLFKNKDGTMMKTLPEISKAMSDTTLMMDTLLPIFM